MKRLFSILALLLIFCGSSLAASKSELKRMSVFISNFTELDYFNFDKDGKYYFYAADGVPTDANVGEFTATAKPHKWNGKNTWAILSLKSKFYEEENE